MCKIITGAIVTMEALILTTSAETVTTFQCTYGGTSFDSGVTVQETQDGGYIIAGSTLSFGAGNKDVYLIKTDAAGDTVWTQTYGGTERDEGYSVQETRDGGFIIAGMTESFGAGSSDVYLIKTDAAGDTLWTKTYGGKSYDAGKSVQETRDGGYIITGSTISSGENNVDVYLIRMNVAGDTVWTQTYGGSNNDFGNSVQETRDGGYIIAGYTSLIESEVSVSDIYLIKTDSAGDTIWTRTYCSSEVDTGNSVQETQDGGYIIAGGTLSLDDYCNSDVYLIKTDYTGDLVWTKTYGGTANESCASVQETQDGGYIIAGSTLSSGAGGHDVYLIRTDATGNTLWTKTYGGTAQEVGRSVQETQDGGYIIAGSTLVFGSGNEEVYLIKTDAQGNTGVEIE